jgi:hypothetical protein
MRHAQPSNEAEIAAWLALERGRLPWERRDDLDAVLSHGTAAASFNLGTTIPIHPTLTLRTGAPRYSAADDITIHRWRAASCPGFGSRQGEASAACAGEPARGASVRPAEAGVGAGPASRGGSISVASSRSACSSRLPGSAL